jgi:hypothetical protein
MGGHGILSDRLPPRKYPATKTRISELSDRLGFFAIAIFSTRALIVTPFSAAISFSACQISGSILIEVG